MPHQDLDLRLSNPSKTLYPANWLKQGGLTSEERTSSTSRQFSHCHVPRLRVNMEGWKEKVKEKAEQEIETSSHLGTAAVTSSHQEDQQHEDWTQGAEGSLKELELKKKPDDQIVHEGRKPKRLRMERLEEWGVGTSTESLTNW